MKKWEIVKDTNKIDIDEIYKFLEKIK
jgi:hypothetical protein